MQIHHLCVLSSVEFLDTVIDKQVWRQPGDGMLSMLEGEATKWSASVVIRLWSRVLAYEVRNFANKVFQAVFFKHLYSSEFLFR